MPSVHTTEIRFLSPPTLPAQGPLIIVVQTYMLCAIRVIHYDRAHYRNVTVSAFLRLQLGHACDLD